MDGKCNGPARNKWLLTENNTALKEVYDRAPMDES